jgi:hypothetical protein
MVPTWEVSAKGIFLKPTGRFVHDAAYGAHFSILDFTWGCIRVIVKSDLVWFAGQVQAELDELRKLDPSQAWITFDSA